MMWLALFLPQRGLVPAHQKTQHRHHRSVLLLLLAGSQHFLDRRNECADFAAHPNRRNLAALGGFVTRVYAEIEEFFSRRWDGHRFRLVRLLLRLSHWVSFT